MRNNPSCRRMHLNRKAGFLFVWLSWLLLSHEAIAGDTVRYVPSKDAPFALTASGQYEEGASFDPLYCSELSCIALLHNIFDPLVRTAQDGKLRSGLADSWQRIDDVTYRFFLKEGVTFQNGEELNSESVRFSIAEVSRVFSRTAWFPEIIDIKVLDKYTVDIVLSEADSLFLYRLNHLGLIRPPRHIRRMGVRRFGQKPIGTGAFTFETWDPESREIRLTANDRYWRSGYPKIDTLIYRYADNQIALDSLIEGDVDLIRRMNPRRTTQFLRSGKGSVVKAWLPQSTFGVYNLLRDNTPLSDIRVRKAINLAINRDHLIRYGFIGNARLLAGYSLPEVPHRAALQPYAFNPTLARELLEEAGYSQGFELTLAVVNITSPEVENIIAKSLDQIGIKVVIRRISEGEWLTETFLSKFGGNAQPDFDIALNNIPMETIFHTGYVPMTFLYSRKYNYSTIQDSHLDDLYEKAIGSHDEIESTALWRKIEKYVYDNHLLLFGYQERAVFGAGTGLSFTPRIMMDFWDSHIDPSRD